MFAYKSDSEKLYGKGQIAFAFISSLFGGFVVGMCALFFASGMYFGMDVWISYIKNPYIFVLNILPPIILSAVLYLLFNRAVWSFILTNALFIIPALINYFKIAFRGDCFVFLDFTLAFEAGKMLENYKLFLDKRIAVYITVLIVGSLLLGFFARGRFATKKRLIAAAIIAALSAALVPLYASDSIYEEKTANAAVERAWTDSRLYISKGFVYPFLHSAKDLIETPPAGYNEEEAKEVLSKYKDEVLADGKKVNLVCLMLEAYNDFSRFKELEFTQDIYAKYHELEKMGYSGTLVTDIFAGDTKVSEREFLTGLPFSQMDKFLKKTNSYVWYLRENGYTTEGSHPLNAWFYNRENVNRNLGFENYYFAENYYFTEDYVDENQDGDGIMDSRLFPEMYKIYTARDKSKPYFSYSISYQGHGPYESESAKFESPYVVSDHVGEVEKNIMNNFLHEQKETTEQLYTFVQDMLKTDEPLVLVFFGDHKPWLGNGGWIYSFYGINIDTSTEEGFMNYYSTRYLIIANDAAKALCQNDFMGEGETISVQFLMNKVFELCGYRGSAYMQFASEVMKDTPVVHHAGETPKLYDNVSYYYRRNFAY